MLLFLVCIMKRLAFQLPSKLSKPVITTTDTTLKVNYNYNASVIKTFSWLKDHSFEAINGSGQKSFSSGQVADIKPLKYDMIFDNNEWKLMVEWQPLSAHYDGIHQTNETTNHTAVYPLQWLIQSNRYYDYALPNYKCWTGRDLKMDSLFVEYDNFMSDSFYESVNKLYDYGFIVLKNCPRHKDTVENIGQQFGPLYDTFYGKSWDVVDTHDKAINVAYTASELGLHMDLMYFKDPPGLQILHCLNNAKEGGENIMSDAYQAAIEMHGLKVNDKLMLDVLQEMKVTFEYHSNEHWMKYSRPMIKMSKNGHVQQINYSPPFQGVLFGNNTLQSSWYIALNEFERRLSHNMIHYKLEENESLIFVNTRITHGRRAYSGGNRHLRGAYVSMCAFLDKYRLCNWQ